MEIKFEIKDPINPANKKTVNLTSDLKHQIGDFINSGNLFSLVRSTFTVSLLCEYKGGSIHKYSLNIHDKVNGLMTFIDLENKYDFKNSSPKITSMGSQSGSSESKDYGRLAYDSIFNDFYKEKIADIIYKRVKKLKNFNYTSGARGNDDLVINNKTYTVPSVLFNQLTVQNLDSIKNLPKNIDMDFFKAISNIDVKNLFSITKEEQETIELLTDVKTPEYLKSGYEVPTSIQKIRNMFKR